MIHSETTSARDDGTSAILHVTGPFGQFANSLLEAELPRLPADSRSATVAFVCRRANEIPGPLRLGVTTLALGSGLAARVVGWKRVTHFARHTQIPLLGDLARLVRSLGFAYVWETWPDTTPDGFRPTAGSINTSTTNSNATNSNATNAGSTV